MHVSNGGPGRVITVDQNVGERLFGLSRKKAASTLVKDDNTLEGKIDLDRVRSIRQALRIRYAARTNIDQLFNEYDVGQKGYVDALDLHN